MLFAVRPTCEAAPDADGMEIELLAPASPGKVGAAPQEGDGLLEGDYAKVERMVAYCEAHPRRVPSPAEVGEALGLTQRQLQLLSRRWSGASIERLLYYMSREYTSEQLRRARVLLPHEFLGRNGVDMPGRKGPWRPLSLTYRERTSGTIEHSWQRSAIRYAFHESPFGTALLAVCQWGICGLIFVTDGRESALAELGSMWPQANFVEDPLSTAPLADSAFGRSDPEQPLPLFVEGTALQVQVWRALLCVPEGDVLTYEDLAERVGRPEAVRGVAQAVAHNPISYLIPCHRVVPKSGGSGNYGGGPLRKKAMLAWEAARTNREPR
jgi:AraC family transcriptional regulator of adaptative response/methylated-DNA-[protein]-cysteine methyltransferase